MIVLETTLVEKVADLADIPAHSRPRFAILLTHTVDDALHLFEAHRDGWKMPSKADVRQQLKALQKAEDQFRASTQELRRLLALGSDGHVERRGARQALAYLEAALCTGPRDREGKPLADIAEIVSFLDHTVCDERLAELDRSIAVAMTRTSRSSLSGSRPRGLTHGPHVASLLGGLIAAALDCDGNLPHSPVAGGFTKDDAATHPHGITGRLYEAVQLLVADNILPAGFLPSEDVNLAGIAELERSKARSE